MTPPSGIPISTVLGAAVAPGTAWAVGYTGTTHPKVLIEHWNGWAWT